MTKWYEVAITHYKNVLVEIEDTGDEDSNWDSVYEAVKGEWNPDELEIQCEVDEANLKNAKRFADEELSL